MLPYLYKPFGAFVRLSKKIAKKFLKKVRHILVLVKKEIIEASRENDAICFFRRNEKKVTARLKSTLRYKTEVTPCFDNALYQGLQNYALESNPTYILEQLCIALLKKNITILPVKDFASRDRSLPTAALRHDIDAYPPAALSMARVYSSLGISGSFYFLHTANYFAQHRNNVFYRNPKVLEWCQEIAFSGSEVGLHNDSLGLYLTHGIKPAESLESDITWLRSSGIQLTGTVAHNSFPVHAAENFEVFDDFRTYGTAASSAGNLLFDSIERSRRALPLFSVSMNALGLDYEANFPIQQSRISTDNLKALNNLQLAKVDNNDWVEAYYDKHISFKRDYDVDIWAVGFNKWIIYDRKSAIVELNAGFAKILNYINQDLGTKSVIFTLHPEYFLKDHLT